ncbi:MAG: PilZ domain-containing protein [Nitrospirota bacterium]
MSYSRKHRRVLISGIAALKFAVRHKTSSIQTAVANISLGGMGLYSYASVKAGTNVSINVNFISATGKLKTASIEGSVIHTKKIERTFFIGIQFRKELNEKKYPSLCEHIQKSLARECR